MAVHTNTFFSDGALASFTATVATVSGTAIFPRLCTGAAAHGNIGVQGEYIKQTDGTYRWLRDAPIAQGGATPTTFGYVLMADEIGA